MIRTDICPNCKTALRWEPPDTMVPAKWTCPKCKFKRWDGAPVTPWYFKPKKRSGGRTR